MFDKHTHPLIAQRLDQAEKQREQIRAISLDYPEDHHRRRLRGAARMGSPGNRRRSHAERPQNPA